MPPPQRAETSSAHAFSKPLYNGAPEDLTEYMAHLLLFEYSMKHSLTGKALDELLHLMSAFLPHDAKLPQSARQLKKYCTHDKQLIMQNYCSIAVTDCLSMMRCVLAQQGDPSLSPYPLALSWVLSLHPKINEQINLYTFSIFQRKRHSKSKKHY